MRYWWLRSPSKLSTVSTICSSTRGPAIAAVLGDMADQHHARSRAPWRSGSAPARRRAPGSPSPARPRSGPNASSGSNRSPAGSAPLPSPSVVRISRTEVAAASCTGAVAQPQPPRAQPHLVRRLLARDIGDLQALRARSSPPPAAAGSTCRSPDRRRSASPTPRRTRRPAPGRARRSRSTSAPAAPPRHRARPAGSRRPPPRRLCFA